MEHNIIDECKRAIIAGNTYTVIDLLSKDLMTNSYQYPIHFQHIVSGSIDNKLILHRFEIICLIMEHATLFDETFHKRIISHHLVYVFMSEFYKDIRRDLQTEPVNKMVDYFNTGFYHFFDEMFANVFESSNGFFYDNRLVKMINYELLMVIKVCSADESKFMDRITILFDNICCKETITEDTISTIIPHLISQYKDIKSMLALIFTDINFFDGEELVYNRLKNICVTKLALLSMDEWNIIYSSVRTDENE